MRTLTESRSIQLIARGVTVPDSAARQRMYEVRAGLLWVSSLTSGIEYMSQPQLATAEKMQNNTILLAMFAAEEMGDWFWLLQIALIQFTARHRCHRRT